jgi:hypothetical protein
MTRRAWSAYLLAALALVGALAATGCVPFMGSAAFSAGKTDPAAQIVADQRLIDVYGEAGAMARLVAMGVSERDATRRVVAAQIARADGARKE